MRVLVTGSRKLKDIMRVFDALDRLHNGPRGPITCIIHGAHPKGGDALGKEWAIERNIKHRPFRAKWEDIWAPGAVVKTNLATGRPYNVLAGFWRNQEMLDVGKPDICVYFKVAGLKNAGTQDMIDRCEKAGIERIEG